MMKAKTLIWILAFLLVASLAANLSHFMGGRSSANSASENDAKQVWTCPMHPTVVQDHPGDCPLCGMALVQQTSTKADKAGTSSQLKHNAAEQYQCPMHPTIIRDHPGDCPVCGMKLVKMMNTITKNEADGNTENRAEVEIDPFRQQLIGLRTATAARGEISAEWYTVGRVQVDPTRVNAVNVKVSGYVERVFADFVGQPVKRGEPLFTYYSPDLFTAQQEYLLALKARGSSDGGQSHSDSVIIAAARQKLRLWDITDGQITHLEQTGEAQKTLAIVSPVGGIVTAKNIVEGSSLNAGDMPYEITDLSTVWIMADAYQSDVQKAKIGMVASMTLESLPDRVFRGNVAFIDPILDPQTRTFKIRINAENSSGELKPDMFAEIMFQGTRRDALTIPADAVIPSGRGSFVFVDAGEGKFQPRAVALGEKAGDRIEVLSGLQEGESVVTRANFLVDSESSLRAALSAVGGSR